MIFEVTLKRYYWYFINSANKTRFNILLSCQELYRSYEILELVNVHK